MMKIFSHIFLLITLLLTTAHAQSSDDDWISLFDGQTFNNWSAAENPETFSIEDGMIVVDGPRAHLFYNGPVENHNFDDFVFKADIMTMENANSGIFFHTQYQEEGWPAHGYEAQINNSYDPDPRRTASVYNVDDNTEITFPDNEWFTMTIRVEGQHITIMVNDEVITDYTEPGDVDRGTNVLSSGTFALQGHDPDSKVYFKNIRVKPL
ncbi:3-keto-disaccharide hydrolase [Rhodohalobacter sulfatireducens]|uniref:DUF1080 domain-containing protein n=1 Tax=Rhodohalobacter sulfatireducens TaxID=2911366 RepID=A0ABS9KDZ2_9BACT|nr:DUF1080 domain-containing protein [Rhodohalobacter sulfatireducens]MCG2589051.1 DUF1080 domain-containing protein [Rhodohalobacter sulfatireducens]